MLIAIEGIDGAGKNTLVERIRGELGGGVEVRTLAFPRYAESIHAQLAREALYGRMGDLTDSVYAMATLFALDRHGARETLQKAARSSGDLLILDRYVASNAAYSAARLGDAGVIEWVRELEFSRLELPVPDLQIFLDTAPEVAAVRAADRASTDASRAKDEYEKDSGLQRRTAEYYSRLAEEEWAGRWIATADGDKIIRAVQEIVGSGSGTEDSRS